MKFKNIGSSYNKFSEKKMIGKERVFRVIKLTGFNMGEEKRGKGVES